MAREAYTEALLTDAIQSQVFRIVDLWGFERPKVHLTWKAERMLYVIRVVFAMRWEIWWEMDISVPDDVDPEYFDQAGEAWAIDANVPIAQEL